MKETMRSKDAVHFKDGGVSALFVESNGDEGSLVHGPFKTLPDFGTVGVFMTVQFAKNVTVARCSICVIISACRLLGQRTTSAAL